MPLLESLVQQFFGSITALGSTYAVIVYVITLELLGEKKSSRILLVSTILTRIVVDGIKLVVARPRPAGAEMITSSFPSGHAALAFMVFAVLGYQYRELRAWLLVLAGVVAASRVVTGVHYVSDVMAGAIIGYLIGALTVREIDDWLGSTDKRFLDKFFA